MTKFKNVLYQEIIFTLNYIDIETYHVFKKKIVDDSCYIYSAIDKIRFRFRENTLTFRREKCENRENNPSYTNLCTKKQFIQEFLQYNSAQ